VSQCRGCQCLTPYHEKDNISLYLGDNCETMLRIPAESVDLVVTSPPYDDLRTYGGHSWDFYGVAWNLKRLLKPGGVIVWIVADATKEGSETGTAFRQVTHFQGIGLRIHDTMIWNQGESSMPGVHRYDDAMEFMFVLSNGKPRTFNAIKDKPNKHAGKSNGSGVKRKAGREQECCRWEGTYAEFGSRYNIWELPGERRSMHPAPFPEALAKDHILSWSNEGDTVLDPFSGSGTTIKMARETGRRGIGIEINEEYCQIAVGRLQQRLLFGAEDSHREAVASAESV
jgi:DNA modification methylase